MVGGGTDVVTHYTRVATYSNMVKTKRLPVQIRPTPYVNSIVRTGDGTPIKSTTPRQRIVDGEHVLERMRINDLRWRMIYEDYCEMLEDPVPMQE